MFICPDKGEISYIVMDGIQQTDIKASTSLLQESVKKAMDYQEFISLMKDLASDGETTGLEQSESYINYTSLNTRRMKRWDKTFELSEEIEKKLATLDKRIQWLVLTESWCGDAAPSLPVMNRFAEANPMISLYILLRDENPELMSQFLTEGAMSIPKLIALDEASGEVIGQWGPRPEVATAMARDYKEQYGKLSAEFREDLQRWYNADKGQKITEELLVLLGLK